MGQKVHPIGFRLGITQPHLSKWFAEKKNYSKYLFEDLFLRETLQKQYKEFGVEKIEILRTIKDYLKIIIYVENSERLVGEGGKNLKNIQKNIKKNIKKYRQSKFFKTFFLTNILNEKEILSVKVAVKVISCSTTNASSIASFLIQFLERRFSYRFALNFVLKKKLQKNLKGIKIQISGRLNGAEIARKEWTHLGRLPLHTLQANIDYTYKTAYTLYGILGVKVWVFK